MYFIFSLLALVLWSGSDLFTKKGTVQEDKYSHWRIIFFVGVIMGAHAVITLLCSIFIPPVAEGASPEWWRSIIYTDFTPMDFIRYLPVAFIYILAMVFGYVALRYIELSVSSPICNSSGSLALVICLILGFVEALQGLEIAGVVLIALGILGLGITEYTENEEIRLMRKSGKEFKYTKSLIAILIPILYLVLDALGTVGDELISYYELFSLSEYACNTAFEFTFLLFAGFAFIFVKFIKKQKFFSIPKEKRTNLIIAGTCETVGQLFYMAVIFSDFAVGIPIISAYCALSIVWSRLFLKEKLSYKHYITIFVIFIGILLLGITEIL